MNDLDMDEKEKEIAATNRLLDIIRGEKRHGTPPPGGSLQPASMHEEEGEPGPSLLDAGDENAGMHEAPVQHPSASDVPEEGEPGPSLLEVGDKNVEAQEASVAHTAAPGARTAPAGVPEQMPQPPRPRQELPPAGRHAPAEEKMPQKQPPAERRMPAEEKTPLLRDQFPLRKERQRPKGLLDRFLRRHERRTIGLDIGSRSIKYVLLQSGIAGLRLLDYRIMELPPGGEGEEKGISARELRSLLDQADLANTRIVSSVSGPSVIVRHVQFPPMTQKELIQSLKWEAKSYIPFPVNEVNLDYQVLSGGNNTSSMDVILVAVTKKTLGAHLDLLKGASIEPDIVDIDPLVFINTYLAIHAEKEEGTIALVCVGAQSSVLSIYRPGGLFFTRDINIAGNAFTKRIQSQWNCSFEQAEAIKRGAPPEGIPQPAVQDVQASVKPAMGEILNEVRRSLVYYDNQTGKRGFSTLVLTGGGALLKGLPEFLGSELGLDVEFLNPFTRLHIDTSGHAALVRRDHAERLSLSVGLALRGTV